MLVAVMGMFVLHKTQNTEIEHNGMLYMYDNVVIFAILMNMCVLCGI